MGRRDTQVVPIREERSMRKLILITAVLAVLTGCGTTDPGRNALETVLIITEQLTEAETPAAPAVEACAPDTAVSLAELETISGTELQTQYEAYSMLARLAMAEAEGEDLYGKAAVVRVALNRLESPQFPDTLDEVIYQPGQFACIWDGRYDAVEPNEDCYLAVEIVLEGWDEVGGALYFERSGNPDSWHARHLEYVTTIGRHDFYR